MATYTMRTSPVTTINEIEAKLHAFTELYGEPSIHISGEWAIATKPKYDGKGTLTFATVERIGKRYLVLVANSETNHRPLKVDMKEPNHGVHEITFVSK